MLKSVRNIICHIALIPPSEIKEVVNNFKSLAQTKFGDNLQYKSPEHITLIPPFRVNNDELSLITKKITNLIKKNYRPIETIITGFYHYNNKTIILEINKNKHLEFLFNELMHITSTVTLESNYRFNPYIPIAKSCEDADLFLKASEYFGHLSYSKGFISNSIGIFNYVDDSWQLNKEIILGDPSI